MFDIERFRVLLRGDDEPQNDEERQWLINYKENQRLSAIKRQEEEEQYFKNHYNAYREYYALIKSTFPKSFFYKHPISSDEYKKFQEYCFDTYGGKIFRILESPLLRAIHLLPQKHPSGDDYGPTLFLEEHYFYRELEKKYKINLRSLSRQFEKYKTPEFMEKLEAIKTKYDERLLWSSFNEYDYLTDWQDYNV